MLCVAVESTCAGGNRIVDVSQRIQSRRNGAFLTLHLAREEVDEVEATGKVKPGREGDNGHMESKCNSVWYLSF